MFWRFGFNNASSIDSLLDKEDVSLEAILDEDELLQECKAQNTRLIDYFQRVDVLQKLLGYVTGQIEGEEKGRFKYPYVATEVLCSEIWSIVETCVGHQDQLLVPFWETVLDRSPEDMKTQVATASHFAKVNAVFLNKKPTEMLAFIKSQPSVVERILRHVETPSFVDLLVRIIQLDERCTGVLEWLSSEYLMGRLIELLSPAHSSDVHTVVAELIKGIISMATPSPGAGLTEGLQNGPASNRFARELAHKDSITKLADYMLHDFGADEEVAEDGVDESDTSSITSTPSKTPNLQTSTSSVVNSISIVIELIRKNNSDYFEPFLFHTLRNRLIQVQQQMDAPGDDSRLTLEQAMKEMVDRMGVVHLGPVLDILGEQLGKLQEFLRKPRSLTKEVHTTAGKLTPLTFERYRICELFAELLHCSNMSLLNRSPQFDYLYDNEGRLQGGLSGLEELSKVIAANSSDERDPDVMDQTNDDIEPALELPVTSGSHSPSSIDSDEDMSDDEPGSSDDDAMEDIAMYDEPLSVQSPTSNELVLEPPPMIVPSSPNAASLPPPAEIAAQGAALSRAASFGSNSDTSDSPTVAPRSHGSRRSSRRTTMMDSTTFTPVPVGEQLKRRYLDIGILSTLLDLFFDFPWNNFLHSAVYDLIHQILTGNVDRGLNRELAVSLFRDARLMHRIVEGQKRNDLECSKPKGVRLGYMGHLTLIAADVITALERFPPELQLTIVEYAPQTWDDYVTGRYNEAKMNDTRLLGGGKPVVTAGMNRGSAQWKVDEADASTAAAPALETNGNASSQETQGEFRRASGSRLTRESSADFGPPDGNDDDRTSQFASFDLHSASNYGSTESDDEDEDGGWLSHSDFSLGNPPVTARHQSSERRPLSGFDDVFNPHNSSDDPFSSVDDDDGFGPFSESSSISGSDPFTFTSSFSDEMEDSTFEGFGEFGEFQSNSGELTPTGGSWTFASDSSISEGSEDAGSVHSPRSQDAEDTTEAETRQSAPSKPSTR
ncbi:SAPS family protein [Pleurotus pulmonarius]